MTAAKRVLVKVDRDHGPIGAFHPWVFVWTEPRDALGRRNARLDGHGTRWLIFRCNNVDCSGRCAVHPAAVTKLLPIHPANRQKAKP